MKPSVPGTLAQPAGTPVVTKCSIAWGGNTRVRAEHQAYRSNEKAPVRWIGDVGKLVDPPQRTDACALVAYLEHQAELTGGVCTPWQGGVWPPMDEVT
jgi:hypothetical protein